MATQALITQQLILAVGDAATGRAIARLVFLMSNWQKEVLTLEGANLAETKKNINRWLGKFEQIFVSNNVDISILYGLQGFADVNTSMGTQGGPHRDDLSRKNFLTAYQSRIRITRGKVLSDARMLRNHLAAAWKGNANSFYKGYDEFVKEANALGIGLKEQTEKFLSQPLNKKFTYMTDSIGRKWKPNHYSTMYARTRGREIEDVVRVDEMKEFGVNTTQVTNAGTTTPICLKYEGKYYWITSPVDGLEQLPIRPPFHPNCVHRLLPVVRENHTKWVKTNRNKGKKYKVAKKGFTPGQDRSIIKQETWNLKNRVQV
jgi:hypothetical protein